MFGWGGRRGRRGVGEDRVGGAWGGGGGNGGACGKGDAIWAVVLVVAVICHNRKKTAFE